MWSKVHPHDRVNVVTEAFHIPRLDSFKVVFLFFYQMSILYGFFIFSPFCIFLWNELAVWNCQQLWVSWEVRMLLCFHPAGLYHIPSIITMWFIYTRSQGSVRVLLYECPVCAQWNTLKSGSMQSKIDRMFECAVDGRIVHYLKMKRVVEIAHSRSQLIIQCGKKMWKAVWQLVKPNLQIWYWQQLFRRLSFVDIARLVSFPFSTKWYGGINVAQLAFSSVWKTLCSCKKDNCKKNVGQKQEYPVIKSN